MYRVDRDQRAYLWERPSLLDIASGRRVTLRPRKSKVSGHPVLELGPESVFGTNHDIDGEIDQEAGEGDEVRHVEGLPQRVLRCLPSPAAASIPTRRATMPQPLTSVR